VPRLDLVVGPNGAGKSTFVAHHLIPALPPRAVFVNADEIAKVRWPGEEEAHGYEAAEIAAQTRYALIEQQRSFVAETVFSHASKRDLIAKATGVGYFVSLHVLLVPEALSVARVAHRVASGGHSVPEVKIRQRHQRLWHLVGQAVRMADEARVYDTSRGGTEVVAQSVAGLLDGPPPRWPSWTPASLVDAWPKSFDSLL
jgi:predicted ABC-type ATPase